jgi:hypothetical protein
MGGPSTQKRNGYFRAGSGGYARTRAAGRQTDRPIQGARAEREGRPDLQKRNPTTLSVSSPESARLCSVLDRRLLQGYGYGISSSNLLILSEAAIRGRQFDIGFTIEHIPGGKWYSIEVTVFLLYPFLAVQTNLPISRHYLWITHYT